MGENSKQVRVDNWGIFFLQRLQMFFSKTDYCDLTLQFEGNVQLKVHRLVMNACTEYFQVLEENCLTDDNVIMMPHELQADVIVPIVNFMYTGMLEYQTAMFHKLYRAADKMNISILTKLLDAQRSSITQQLNKTALAKKSPVAIPTPKKAPIKLPFANELATTLPGRKLPVWKRNKVPLTSSRITSPSLPTSSSHYFPPDPLSVPDNTPKPTRFEWPDDDLPQMSLLESNFEDISYNSKPLLTKDEEIRASSSSFDDIKSIPNATNVASTSLASSKKNNLNVDIEDMKDYVKEQKIRSDLANYDGDLDDGYYGDPSPVQKRKMEKAREELSPKRIKLIEKENSKETTISVSAPLKGDLDHTKIVSELLKKYPHLVKNNKNIRLKIMATGSGGNKTTEVVKQNPSVKTAKKVPGDSPPSRTLNPSRPGLAVPRNEQATTKEASLIVGNKKDAGPWKCAKCNAQEFVLYYLYRKHMIDEHHLKFDETQCKYCSYECKSQNLMVYHLYTKHALKPPPTCDFPKCELCPFIAPSALYLYRHQQMHNKNEVQCMNCQLAFTGRPMMNKHMQITGHMSKENRVSYDCQYCTKRYPSPVNLFSHIKLQHLIEAKRDGIVLIDDIEDYEHEEPDQGGTSEKQNDDIVEEEEEEYIVPEIIPNDKERVKILSDVKVAPNVGNSSTDGGIATSLGLVDIVVLDDNQQYILQQPQQPEQHSEFILPSDNPFGSQVIGNQPAADIASTDELVMVLTDHDYNDAENTESNNSNIVVLYTHPVDGQQGQFISTSQGNLMVNSQTGMLELHNAGTAEDDGHLVINDANEPQIESIELIQREIDSHTGNENKTTGNGDENTFYSGAGEEQQQEPQQDTEERNEIEQEREESVVEVVPEEKESETGEIEQPAVEIQEQPPTQEEDKVDDNIDEVDNAVAATPEPMEVDEPLEEEPKIEKEESDLIPQENSPPPPPLPELGEDVPPLINTKSPPPLPPDLPPITEEETNETEEETNETEEEPIVIKETELEPEKETYIPEPMEVDGKKSTQIVTEEELQVLEENNDPPETVENNEKAETAAEPPTNVIEESEEKISILEDWDDTDSQQSEQPPQQADDENIQEESVKTKPAASTETVEKLIGDWDEEDEDDVTKKTDDDEIVEEEG